MYTGKFSRVGRWLVIVAAWPTTDCRAEQAAPAQTSAANSRYDAIVARIEKTRIRLARAWNSARRDSERRDIHRRAARFITYALIDEILPAWNGTLWNFYGTSAKPRAGAIACGYFVTTTLRDAGLPVDRVRLAQAPAEAAIRALVPAHQIQRFSRVPIGAFVQAVRAQGDGLYLLGLDTHIGFLIVDRGHVAFHHSGGGDPPAVIREVAVNSPVVVASQYRVAGKLFSSTPWAAPNATAARDLIAEWLRLPRP